MAKDWGTPPWELMQAPGSVRWAARWSAYKRAEAEARKSMAPRKKKAP